MGLPKLSVPIYTIKLLSTDKDVQFRPFLVKEQKLFLMAAQSDDPKDAIDAIKQVLSNCLVSKDVDVNELSSFDLEYLFINLRAKSVGEIVKLKYTCNNIVDDKVCGGINKFDVNLTELKPTIDPKHSKKIEITPNLGIVMKYPTFNMISKLQNISGDTVFDLIVDCIDYIYDADNIYYAKDIEREEIVEFLENMQRDDFEKIEQFFNSMPKISKDLNFVCPKCGYEEKITIEGVQNFFG